jgi:DNA-binding MarR family transcriptional regulator
MNDGHYIAMALRAAYLRMHRETNFCLLTNDITADQFVILTILKDNNGITQQLLTEKSASDPNTIRAIIRLLQKKGLVSVRAHPKDRRANIVRITTKGSNLQKICMQQLGPLQKFIGSLFSEEEAGKLLDYLARIASGINSLVITRQKAKKLKKLKNISV